ncbi:hypothetical protein LJC59_10065 [Desulfovibrio sp. OttesenSCG-928-A18]|nr:hypothetical protein [Desulfovibrio sp. OttesenSCG-928-A18]
MKRFLSLLCFVLFLAAAGWKGYSLLGNTQTSSSSSSWTTISDAQPMPGAVMEITNKGIRMVSPVASRVNQVIEWSAIILCLLAGIALRADSKRARE